MRPIAGVGSSPISSRYTASANDEPAHHLVERVAANEDLVGRGGRERRCASGRSASAAGTTICFRIQSGWSYLHFHFLAVDAKIHLRQTVPYRRSPKSPSPGTMYFCAFSPRSTTGV